MNRKLRHSKAFSTLKQEGASRAVHVSSVESLLQYFPSLKSNYVLGNRSAHPTSTSTLCSGCS